MHHPSFNILNQISITCRQESVIQNVKIMVILKLCQGFSIGLSVVENRGNDGIYFISD